MSGRHLALLVEDEPLTAELVAKLLHSIGHDSVIAATMEDAERLLQEDRFCYMLADQHLPRGPGAGAHILTGRELSAFARNRNREKNGNDEYLFQIIVMSQHLETDADGARAMLAGGTAYIRKPFTPDELIDVVKDALRRAQRESHDPQCESATGYVPVEQVKSAPRRSAADSRVQLDITGEFDDGQLVVTFDDRRVPLGARSVRTLCCLVLTRLRNRDHWCSITELGGVAGQGFNAMSKLTKEVRKYFPRLSVHEPSRGKGWRLAWGIEVRDINFEALLAHPDDPVKTLAAQIRAQLKANRDPGAPQAVPTHAVAPKKRR